MPEFGITDINNREHIAPDKTGDNIAAKKVATYVWTGSIWTRMTQPGNPTASTTGGYTPFKLISAASTNATNIKASAGTIGYITASSINAAARYLKIYNTAGAPTVGTDVPVHTFIIPGNTAGTGTNIPLPGPGISMSTGISIAITTGITDADTGAVALNEIAVNIGWV